MPNYQIKLTPVESFFFGGEKHDANLHDANLVANYFVESNLYPQQTTLLGLVRYYLLLKNGTIFKDNKIIQGSNVDAFIGDKSFDYVKADTPQNFGKIQSISPLYFTDGTENYFFAPIDFGATLNEGFILNKDIKKKNKEEYSLEDYTAKEHEQFVLRQLINKKGETIKLSDIVIDTPQVGNEKAERGATDEAKENAFYKINMKRLVEKWSFVIDVEISDDANVKEESLFLPFGGEKSFFKMDVKKQNKFVPQLPISFERNVNTLVCISDCFLPDVSLLKTADFAVSDFVGFRNLKSKASGDVRYSSLSKGHEMQLSRSMRFNLIQRGSVFYFRDQEKFKIFYSALENERNSHNIGFNQFLTINQK